ncbi:hypothetical protein VPG91_22450 [Nitrospirillum amazonense]|uniref:hypothetical protein n=1 Tax=Nitrospirillum amazonense TaxID=28077 RepID=UPI002DD432CC|nr:hypothetical protein [Nitrospirillum amazonense]MEC4593779.1 hypothetical protein [Nitrospirillum amazonense]
MYPLSLQGRVTHQRRAADIEQAFRQVTISLETRKMAVTREGATLSFFSIPALRWNTDLFSGFENGTVSLHEVADNRLILRYALQAGPSGLLRAGFLGFLFTVSAALSMATHAPFFLLPAILYGLNYLSTRIRLQLFFKRAFKTL